MALATAVNPTATLTTTATRQTGQGTRPIPRLQVGFRFVTYPQGTVESKTVSANISTDVSEWVDIIDYARSVDYQRGRNFELDQFQAGTLSAVLSTNDGRFSPENSLGVYYEYLTPMRPIRLIVEWEGNVYNRFRGFVESWEPATNENGLDLVTAVKATDAFKAARYAEITGTYAAALTGNQIYGLLGGIPGVSVNPTSTGTQTQNAITVTNADPVSTAQRAAFGEQALLYCDNDGAIRFDDRNYRLANETAPKIVFGDGIGEEPYQDPVYAYTDEQVYTEVRITPQGGAEQIAASSSGVAKFGERVLSQTITVQNSLTDTTPNTSWASSLASYLLANYSQPTIRLTELHCSPDVNTTLWPKVLQTNLGSRILVRQRPSYAQASGTMAQTSTSKVTGTAVLTAPGGIIDRNVYVERIQETIRPGIGKWDVKYGFSNADAALYWVLGDNSLGVLGFTTRIGV